jgi:hypothetical protein
VKKVTPGFVKSGLAAKNGAGDGQQVARRWQGQKGDGIPRRQETNDLRVRGGEQEWSKILPSVNRDTFDGRLLTVCGHNQRDVLAPARLLMPCRRAAIGRGRGKGGGNEIATASPASTSLLGRIDLLNPGRNRRLIGKTVVLAAGASNPRCIDADMTLRADAKRERRAGDGRRHLRQQQHQG